MRQRILLALVAAGLLARPCAAQTDPPPIVLRVAGVETVEVRADLPYKTVPTANGSTQPVALALDVYTPRDLPAGARRPVLIFVHGGIVPGPNPMPKAWRLYQSWGRTAAASGWIGVTFNHRMTIRDNVAEAGSDLLDLIAYVRRNASGLRADADRMCVMFFSAGGPISSVLLRDPEPHVRCIVLFYPYLDLEHLRLKTPFREPYSATTVDSLLAYSPAGALAGDPARLPPIFLAKAGRDQIPYLNASVDRFLQAAVQHEVTIDFVLHRTGEHGFDARNDDPRTHDILEQSLAFVKRHLER